MLEKCQGVSRFHALEGGIDVAMLVVMAFHDGKNAFNGVEPWGIRWCEEQGPSSLGSKGGGVFASVERDIVEQDDMAWRQVAVAKKLNKGGCVERPLLC
jgi:hypothetical protein